LVKRLEDGGLVVDPYTGTPDWDGSQPDLGLAVEYLLARNSKKEGDRAHEGWAGAGAGATPPSSPAAPVSTARRPYHDARLAAITDPAELDDEEPFN
jgi:hypothetical protein